MTSGSPRDLNIPARDEPIPDSMSKKENQDVSSGNADQGKEKLHMRKWLSQGVIINHFALYAILILSGLDLAMYGILFSLDSWVLVVLIGSVMGSSTVYFWKRMVDYAFSR